MFQTCIFCHKYLGANESIEQFPVGRRLAFDGAKGRLWVVCRSCERWNLSPLDTRWEAIEECERAFRDTRMRVSTDNIGLARLPEGLELVRVGAPQRPEFAAWRYGDQFGRRRRRTFLVVGGVATAVGAVAIAGAAAGIGFGAFGGIWGNIPNMINASRKVKLRTADGRLLKVNGVEFAQARLVGAPDTGAPQLSVKVKRTVEIFEGPEALALAGRLLPAINVAGGGKRAVQEAVQDLDAQHGSEAYLERYFTSVGPVDRKGRPKPVSTLPAPTRLALEMALHEEAERRAIEGELAVLEAAWAEAEEIAGISDNMLLPASVEAKLEELKRPEGPAPKEPPDA
jgi:hypothetical protein